MPAYLQSSSNPFGSSNSARTGNPNYQQSPPAAGSPSMAQFMPQQSRGMPQQQMQMPAQQPWQPPSFPMPQFNYATPDLSIPELSQSGGGMDWLQNFIPPQLNVSSGISPPQMPGAPSAPQMPGMAGSPGMQAGGQASYASSIGPMLSELLGQFYQGSAPINSGAQQAQAESGLGWMGLGSGLANQQQDYQAQQQMGLMALLQDMFARSYA